jgi:hypothetical protein
MRSLLDSLFHIVHLIKPSASREESSEMYLLAMQYHENISIKTNQTNQNEIEKLLDEARRVRTKKKSNSSNLKSTDV